jgi:hypothetical protein
MKRDEISRYQQAHSAADDRIVTQWELDEYIEEF